MEDRWYKTVGKDAKGKCEIFNVDYAFESAPYDQIGSSYVEEDADTSAVPGEPGQGGP